MGMHARVMSKESYDEVSGGAELGPFVLDLCLIPGPVAIPQPRSPQLSRFSFFCRRREEDSRDRYWLQMGYFASWAEAQKWQGVLRNVYPDARIREADLSVSAEYGISRDASFPARG